MSFLKKYKVIIGKGEVYEGSISGKVSFIFDKEGLFFYFNDIKGGYRHKQITNFNLKKKVIDKIQKGSNLAKFGAFMVAANKKSKNIGAQIALSQRMADAGRDKVLHKEINILECSIGRKFISIVLDVTNYPKIVKDINLAYNNPKSFFNETLNKDSDKFAANKKSKLFWWIYWIIGIMLPTILTSGISSEDAKQSIGFLVFIILFIYPLFRRFKTMKDGSTQVNNFKKTEEYKKIIKSL